MPRCKLSGEYRSGILSLSQASTRVDELAGSTRGARQFALLVHGHICAVAGHALMTFLSL